MITRDELALTPVTRSMLERFAAWAYEPPYDVYNLGTDSGTIEYMLDPKVNCHAILDGNDLIGYATFGLDAQVPGGDYSADRLDIGMAISPSLLGHGLGGTIAQAVVDFAWARFEPAGLRVTIAANNRRANRVWEGVGFVERSTFTTERTILNSHRWRVLDSESDETD